MSAENVFLNTQQPLTCLVVNVVGQIYYIQQILNQKRED